MFFGVFFLQCSHSLFQWSARGADAIRLHLFEVVVKCIEEEEQQLLGILLGVVVELREDGEEHGPGLHGGTAGAPARPHLLQ